MPFVQLTYTIPANLIDNKFTLGAVTKNKKKGTANQAVTVPGAGVIKVSGSSVKAQTVNSTKAETVSVLIKAAGNKKKKLKKKGKVKVTPTFTFTPTGGLPSEQTKKIKLKRQ